MFCSPEAAGGGGGVIICQGAHARVCLSGQAGFSGCVYTVRAWNCLQSSCTECWCVSTLNIQCRLLSDWTLEGGVWLGEEAEEPSWMWGLGAQWHKAPFPAPPCGKWQESKEEGKKGEGGSGGRRRREQQLVGSSNHQGNTHLIDM